MNVNTVKVSETGAGVSAGLLCPKSAHRVASIMWNEVMVMNYIYRCDEFIFTKINCQLRCNVLNRLMPVFTVLGGAAFTVLVGLALIICGGSSGVGWDAAAALAGSQLIVQVAKRCITRRRPYLDIPGTNIWKRFVLKDYSFPSGHTTAGFALATALSIHYPAIAPVVLLMAAAIGFSRIYMGMHYPTDVFVGAVIGIVSVLVVSI